MPTAPYHSVQPLTAPYSPSQPFTGGGGVQPVGIVASGQGCGPRARARRQRPQAHGRHDQGSTCYSPHGIVQVGSDVLHTDYFIITTYEDGKSDNSDPYLKLSHGDEQRRTETHALSLDPIWDEIFQFDGKGVGTSQCTTSPFPLTCVLLLNRLTAHLLC